MASILRISKPDVKLTDIVGSEEAQKRQDNMLYRQLFSVWEIRWRKINIHLLLLAFGGLPVRTKSDAVFLSAFWSCSIIYGRKGHRQPSFYFKIDMPDFPSTPKCSSVSISYQNMDFSLLCVLTNVALIKKGK